MHSVFSAGSNSSCQLSDLAQPLNEQQLAALYRSFVAAAGSSRGTFFFDAPDAAAVASATAAATDGSKARITWIGVGSLLAQSQFEDFFSREIVQAEQQDLIPGGFSGGVFGWANYDQWADLASGAHAVLPELSGRWFLVDYFVVQDNFAGKAYLVVRGGLDLAEIRELVLRSIHNTDHSVAPFAEDVPVTVAKAAVSPQQYRGLVDRARAEIAVGNAYQLCLTTSFSGTTTKESLELFLELRDRSGTGRCGLIEHGDDALISASPEQFLYVADGFVSTEPIKGTRPRFADRGVDEAAAGDLAASVKERAENVMIVDLMRNDFAKVAETASVAVPELLQVASYPSVHQLYSRVSAKLAGGVSWRDLFAATFPAGSMTGAPKAAAIDILRGLEQRSRGVYAGCFGLIGFDGFADLRMVIRTIFKQGDEFSLGAGGGIMWLSDAEEETSEVALKAQLPLSVLGARLPLEWQKTLPATLG